MTSMNVQIRLTGHIHESVTVNEELGGSTNTGQTVLDLGNNIGYWVQEGYLVQFRDQNWYTMLIEDSIDGTDLSGRPSESMINS
jgi:hypothetical protein